MQGTQILVVASNDDIGALIGALGELAGHVPLYPSRDGPGAAITRLKPRLVLLDYDVAAAWEDRTYRDARAMGSTVILFSSSMTSDDVAAAAARRSVGFFALPIHHNAFARLIERTLADPSDRAAFA